MGNQIKTLGDLEKVAPNFGSEAVKFVQIKIDESPDGRDEPVLADDTQIMFLMLSLADRASAMAGEPI